MLGMVIFPPLMVASVVGWL